MQLPQLLASAALAALVTALATDSSANCHDNQVAILDSNNPVVGDPCSRNEQCAANSELYCSPEKGNTCQTRSGPGDACENTDGCFQGECRGGVCGGKREGSSCEFSTDCADPLVCRPDLVGDNDYRFACMYPARKEDFGASCRDDSNCGFPFFCVIGDVNRFCGINPYCVGKGENCSVDKDCCRLRCIHFTRGSLFDYWQCF